MAANVDPPKPITLRIPPSLLVYNKSVADMLVDRPAEGFCVGTFVFAHPTDGESRLLLVQREKGDGALAGKWEVPGGGCETSDPTILHSAARELFEEAGLHMTRAVCSVGSEHYFTTRRGLRVVKAEFEVEVQEIVDQVALSSIPVELSHEHQGFVWVTEEEFRAPEKYPTSHENQRLSILEAFRLHNARLSGGKPSTGP